MYPHICWGGSLFNFIMLHSYFSDDGWFAFMVYIINLLVLKKELLIASLCLVVACVVLFFVSLSFCLLPFCPCPN